MKYYSQYKQDKIVDIILRKNNGVFIDVGANDGITYSNTYYFEKSRGWTGICIEPIYETFMQLEKVRNCVCLNIGVWHENKCLKFYKVSGYAEMLSGIVESFEDEHFVRLQKEVELFEGTIETIDIDVYTLNSIFYDNSIREVDFCSIDTEGSELQIISSIDFDKYRVKMFAIENNYNNDAINKLLKKKKYLKLTRLGGDDIYILKEEFSNLKIKLRFVWFQILRKIELLNNYVASWER